MSPRGFPCGCCSVLPHVCLDGQNQYQEAQNLGSQPLGSPQMVHTESGPSVNICCSLQSPAATVTRKPRPQLSTQSKTIYCHRALWASAPLSPLRQGMLV